MRKRSLEAGAIEASEAAAEIVRVERGRPRYGVDLDESTIPQEAGLNERAVSFTKGCYVGQETVARLHYRGKPNRHLRGLRLSEPVEPGAELRSAGARGGTPRQLGPLPHLRPDRPGLVRREAEPGEYPRGRESRRTRASSNCPSRRPPRRVTTDRGMESPPAAAQIGLQAVPSPTREVQKHRGNRSSTSLPSVNAEPGELPATMAAWVIREERQGEPKDAFQLEEIEVPEPGAFEVIVRVMAAGVNYNNVWAALGKPVSVMKYGDHPQYGHHIGGSDASGVVWKVGAGVTRWKPGDEVVVHCNQASYEDPEVHGLDPMAAPSQKIWGYETTWGSFAQFTKVQAQQLLPKPKALSWSESASYGLVYFTAYRMLITRCKLQAGQKVLIWGAAGGLGVFATQLCAAAGAHCVGVVSSAEKGELVKRLGAVDYIDRAEFAGMMRKGGESPEEEKARFLASREFSKRVKQILGDAPDIVFEHVGQATFPTSVFTVKPFGKVVICAGTTGFNLDFDVRYLWMKQKEILGSHFANAYECMKANELIESGQIRPVLWRTLGFEGVAEAHQLMLENKHLGKISILVGAESEEEGKTADGPGAIHAEVGG